MAEVALKDEIKWCDVRAMSYEYCVETIYKYEQRVVPDTSAHSTTKWMLLLVQCGGYCG